MSLNNVLSDSNHVLQQWPFFRLPAELRDTIFRFALPPSSVYIRFKNGGDRIYQKRVWRIIRVCRLFYIECTPLLYARLSFQCLDCDSTLGFLSAIGPNARSHITHLTIYWPKPENLHNAYPFLAQCTALKQLRFMLCDEVLADKTAQEDLVLHLASLKSLKDFYIGRAFPRNGHVTKGMEINEDDARLRRAVLEACSAE